MSDDQADIIKLSAPGETAAADTESKTASTAAPIKASANDTHPKPSTNSQSAPKGPMTQAQYQQLHSQIHEVVDPHTGRTRWQRGTGEIVERIVSREQQMNLNACATRGDGASFGRDVVRAALKK